MRNTYLFSSDGATFFRNIHTPSFGAKKSFVYLQESGELKSVKCHSGKRRSNLESYLFFIVTSGSGTFSYDNKNYFLKKNDCIFIDCKKTYSHKSSKDDQWSLKWVHFYGEPAKEYYRIFKSLTQSPVFCAVGANDIKNCINLLNTTSDDNVVSQDVINSKLLTELCTYCINSVQQKPSGDDITKIKSYIDENYFKRLTLESIAAQFYISKFTLAHKFKEEIGTTVLEYITKRRITKAKELLRYTDKTVEQISEECGICDANYFSKVFKKNEGMSAREYRKQW